MLLKEALPRFRDLLDEVWAVSRTLRFDSGNQQHLLGVSLHGSILEYARGIMALLQNGDATCTFVLLRSLVEAAIDLFNLAADPRYMEFMHYAFLEQQHHLLEVAVQASNANPYLVEFSQNQTEVSAKLDQVRAEIRKLKKRGIKLLSARERFARAQQSHLYHGPYWDLCQHSHNNIAALERRHLRQTSNGFQIAYFSSPSDDDVILLLDTAAGLVANSIALLHQLVNGDRLLELEGVTRQVNELRALWKVRA